MEKERSDALEMAEKAHEEREAQTQAQVNNRFLQLYQVPQSLVGKDSGTIDVILTVDYKVFDRNSESDLAFCEDRGHFEVTGPEGVYQSCSLAGAVEEYLAHHNRNAETMGPQLEMTLRRALPGNLTKTCSCL